MDQNGELSALIPMGRLGLVEEVAEAAAFLATNSYAHNCVLNIDGGLSGT
jgi:NAD(P)-dependent dehydrogenase (short-subunit alcohol dehydrogenase family)